MPIDANYSNIQTGWYVTYKRKPVAVTRSASLTVARHAQRLQPVHDVSDSRFQYFCILSILRKRAVAFDDCDQKARSLFWDHFPADCSLRLSPSQSHGNCFSPGTEYPLQSLAESLVKGRHFLRQIEQFTATPYSLRLNGYASNYADQGVDRVLALLQRMQPLVAVSFCDDLFDAGMS